MAFGAGLCSSSLILRAFDDASFVHEVRSSRAPVRSLKASESLLLLSCTMTIALLIALAGSLGLMAVIVRRLERS